MNSEEDDEIIDPHKLPIFRKGQEIYSSSIRLKLLVLRTLNIVK